MRARGRCRPLLALGSFLLSGSSLPAQAVLTGLVREDSTNRPLAGVEVLVERTKRQTVTDNAGRFVLTDVPLGTRVALFRYIGFQPVRLRLQVIKGDTIRADAIMVPVRVQQLAPVEVTGAVRKPRGVGLEAFEERRSRGQGIFIDSTELRRSEMVRLADVLRRHALDIARVPDPRVPNYPRYIYVAVSKHRFQEPGQKCPMQVIVDGTVMTSTQTGPLDLNMFEVASLQAVEVYRTPAETPMEYAGAGGDCGTVLLWSRRP